jgi:hypothetical protein
MYFILVFLLLFCFLIVFIFFQINKKNLGIWIGSYIWQRIEGRPKIRDKEPIHIIFCTVDHFEPIQKLSTKEEERERMKAWIEGYPKLASKHMDSNGRTLQHTWFYPGEAYDPEYLDRLADLCRRGHGEIEFHHHHQYETSKGLRKSIVDCLEKFAKHGALITNINGRLQHTYGFIHGNMALDNSRFNDRFCGVNDELTILKETGCYADFSAPTAPCVSQTRKINSLYYAKDDPDKPKSHDTGIDVEVGKKPTGDLMIIQGPLALNWKNRKFGIFPTIDTAEVMSTSPGTPDRIDEWVSQHIHVKGKPNWVFVKVSCHGAEDRNYDVLLGEKADWMYSHLEKKFKEKPKYRLHYVTARELYNIVKAAEAGMKGNPYDFRNLLIPPYVNCRPEKK